MAEYRITNRTHAAVRIEDLGITLQVGESKTVHESAFNASKDVKALNRWVRVDRINEVAPVKIWPFSRPEPAAASVPATRPEPPPQPALVPQATPPQAHLDVVQLGETVRELTRTVSELTRALASGTRGAATYVPGARVQAPSSDLPADPVYVPSSILPKDAEVRINVKQEQADKDDFDASAAALRNLRKRPPKQ